jgi:soluble lytic murein transglycosylase-like protein
MRWSGENTFDTMVAAAAIQYGVDGDLIKAVIGQESGFNPKAFRPEPPPYIGSYGLMQLLPSTAMQFGFSSSNNDDLFAPWTNILIGSAYLASLLKQLGDVPSAVSAYNGGVRPALGFGAPSRIAQTICLARDANGKCLQSVSVQPGQFANQSYVNNVMANLTYFKAVGPVAPPTPTAPTATTGKPAAPLAVGGGLLLALAAAAAYFLTRGR